MTGDMMMDRETEQRFEAIEVQLREREDTYIVPGCPTVKDLGGKEQLMWGVYLNKAFDAKLNIPSKLLLPASITASSMPDDPYI